MEKLILDNKKAECLQKQTGNFGFWYHLGNDYLKINEAIEAIECYETALKFDPLIFDTYSHIGEAYLRLDKLLDAIIYFKKSVDIQPQYGTGWYNLGYAYSLSSDMAQCLYCYEKSIQCYLLPSDDSFYNMGCTFIKENDLKRAFDCLQLAINSVSSKTKKDYRGLTLIQIGHIYFLKGEIELAREVYYKSMRCFENYAIFFKTVEGDLPILMKIGLNSKKWYNLLNEIRNPWKMYFKIYLNKINNYIRNKIFKKLVYQEATNKI
jgi:tetratricopeptide (TPR) repeat protein